MRQPPCSIVAAFAFAMGCGGASATEGPEGTGTTGGSGDLPGPTGPSTEPAEGSTSGADTTLGGPSGSHDGGSSETGAEPASPRYDAVRQKSSHNAYQRDEAPFDQLVYHRVRSLEFDIHVGKTFAPTASGEWYVYHTDIVDDATWCVRLGHCLEAVAAFTQTAADHEVVTLWIDLKDPWDDTHGPDELDAALRGVFGEALIGPAELLERSGCGDAPSLQAALTDPRCGWPSVDALRGRVLVVLTGADSVLRTYHDESIVQRVALVAPSGVGLGDAGVWPNTAVFNFAAGEVAQAAAHVSAGHVARVWDCNDASSWDAAVAAGAHHIGTDMVSAHADPWARTHDGAGWPFACADECPGVTPESEVTIVGIDVDSGDIWGTADSGWFLYDDHGDAPDGTWRGFVSTPNSHVDPFAKGCLMARASTDAGAPYFAVCRPADDEPLRVQWRPSPGASSTAAEDPITAPNTLDGEGAAFMRLRVSDGGTCIAGDGSADGVTWVEIAARCFDAPLPLQGIAASSHDSGAVRLLFGGITHEGGGPAQRYDLGEFGAAAAFGSAAADAYDGVLP